MLRFDADPNAKLVGRATELTVIREVLASARMSRVGAVSVLGEPGIGKTRVLDELCRQAAAAGFEVLAGRGSEFERDLPYGLVIDALDERFRRLEAEVRRHLAPDVVAELATVLPSMPRDGRRLVSRLQIERFEFHRAVQATFKEVIRGRPIVLALDDVHWADPASVELIGSLLRRPLPGMVLAVAYRPRQTSRLLVSALQDARRERLLRELELAPLTIGEAAELLARRASSRTVRSLYSESGGNPFFLEELARNSSDRPLPTRHRAYSNHQPERPVPFTVHTVIARELTELSSRTIEILQAAAVAGDPFEVDLLTEIIGDDKPLVLGHLDALVETDLVQATGTAGIYRFRHPIVRRVVYDEIKPGWRFGAHHRAARALARRGASAGMQAHHVHQSATLGDIEAVAILTEAGNSVATRAPEAAAGWFEAALRLLPENSGGEQRLRLVISQADSLASAGRLHDSRTVLEEALKSLPEDSAEDRVRIIEVIVRADHGLGRAEEARVLITSALKQLKPDTQESVALHLKLAENQFMTGRWEAAVDAAASARRQAQVLANRTLILAANASLAFFAGCRGNTDEARKLIDSIVDEIDAYDVALTPVLLQALADLVIAETTVDRYHDAARHAERGLRSSRATGHNYLYGRFTFDLAVAKMMLGQLHEAEAAAESAVEAAGLLDNDQLLATAEGIRCWVKTARGNLPEALAAGRTATRAADRQPDALLAWMARACYSDALIEAGEVERGREELVHSGGPDLFDLPPNTRAFWQQALVTAELFAGRIDAARAVAQQSQDGASVSSRQGSAHYAWARIHLTEGDVEAAARSAHQAVRCFDEVGLRVWAARARLTAGRAYAVAGERTAAVRELELAFGTLEDCGADRLRDEAAKELRSLGVRVRRQVATGELAVCPELTARERSIADRVVLGYTNRDIATELFISPKTVEKHLGRILAKLGISSRAGVAAAMHRHSGELH